MVDVSIIIPTYNERENLKKLIPGIAENLHEYNYEMIVVDDSSPDGTAATARELANDFPVRVIERPKKLGLSSAVVKGFKESVGKCIGVVDADLQYPPNILKIPCSLYKKDMIVGSRYIDGGGIKGRSSFKYIVSKGTIILSRPLQILKSYERYFFLKRKTIDDISFDLKGYDEILLKILVKGSVQQGKRNTLYI
jgi:dolichol-phosphate mannosyltransferase